jgi:hypothetical protein
MSISNEHKTFVNCRAELGNAGKGWFNVFTVPENTVFPLLVTVISAGFDP